MTVSAEARTPTDHPGAKAHTAWPTTIAATHYLLNVAKPPSLLVAARFRPGHDLEVPVESGLEEPATAYLLDCEESTAKIKEAPALRVVVLLRARDHPKVEALNLMCVEEPAATDLNDGLDVTAYIRQPPVLGVVVLERPGDHAEVPLLDLVGV